MKGRTQRILFIVLLITIVFGFSSFKASADTMDGYFWNDILKAPDPNVSNLALVLYVKGYWNGISFGSDYKTMPVTTNFSDYVEQLTEWYEDPANRRIPATVMLHIANEYFKGAISKEQIQERLPAFRKIVPQ